MRYELYYWPSIHHPIASALYYHEQKREAARRAAHFTAGRARQFLRYFEGVLQANAAGQGWMVGRHGQCMRVKTIAQTVA